MRVIYLISISCCYAITWPCVCLQPVTYIKISRKAATFCDEWQATRALEAHAVSIIVAAVGKRSRK